MDIPHFISIFCQKIRIISVGFCYTADKLGVRENILSQEKVWENQILKMMY